jgi:hypothetical protein
LLPSEFCRTATHPSSPRHIGPVPSSTFSCSPSLLPLLPPLLLPLAFQPSSFLPSSWSSSSSVYFYISTPGLGEWHEVGWSERDTGSKSNTGDCAVRTYLTLDAGANHRGGCRHTVTSEWQRRWNFVDDAGEDHPPVLVRFLTTHNPSFFCEYLPMSFLDSQRLCAVSVLPVLVCALFALGIAPSSPCIFPP